MVQRPNRHSRISTGTFGAVLIAALAAVVIGCGGGGGGGGGTTGTTTFTNGNTNGNTNNTTNGNTTNSTTGTGVLTPDRIYYSRQTGDTMDVRYVNPNGSGDTSYLTLPAGFSAVAINSANTLRFFAYQSTPDANFGIFRNTSIAADGATQLVSPQYAFVTSMQLSNDGTTLYYVAAAPGDTDASLYKLTLSAGGPVRLDAAESAHLNPANNMLVYSKFVAADTELFVRGVNPGDVPTQITDNAVFDDFPQWNKQGTKIVFARSPDGGIYDIYTRAPTAGGTETQITNTPAIDERTPSFNQVGDTIAFVADTGDLSTKGIWRASASGTDQGKVLVKNDAQIAAGTYWTGTNGRSRTTSPSVLDRLRKKAAIKE
jgi:Tol biopolymer transport system component